MAPEREWSAQGVEGSLRLPPSGGFAACGASGAVGRFAPHRTGSAGRLLSRSARRAPTARTALPPHPQGRFAPLRGSLRLSLTAGPLEHLWRALRGRLRPPRRHAAVALVVTQEVTVPKTKDPSAFLDTPIVRFVLNENLDPGKVYHLWFSPSAKRWVVAKVQVPAA
jgi:hypothetical protein